MFPKSNEILKGKNNLIAILIHNTIVSLSYFKKMGHMSVVCVYALFVAL